MKITSFLLEKIIIEAYIWEPVKMKSYACWENRK